MCALAAPAPAHASARIVVGFREPQPRAAQEAVLQASGAALDRPLRHLRAVVARVPSGHPSATLAALRARPGPRSRSPSETAR